MSPKEVMKYLSMCIHGIAIKTQLRLFPYRKTTPCHRTNILLLIQLPQWTKPLRLISLSDTIIVQNRPLLNIRQEKTKHFKKEMQVVGHEYRKGIQYSKGIRGSECYPMLSWEKKWKIYMEGISQQWKLLLARSEKQPEFAKVGNENQSS